jgi:hypothetical protein
LFSADNNPFIFGMRHRKYQLMIKRVGVSDAGDASSESGVSTHCSMSVTVSSLRTQSRIAFFFDGFVQSHIDQM